MVKELIGKKFNMLTVTGRVSDTVNCRVICKCDCGVIKPIQVSELVSGRQKSCGCWRVKHNRNPPRPPIKKEDYVLIPIRGSEEYAVVDIDDYELANKYSWFLAHGYATSNMYGNKHTKLHRLILNLQDRKQEVDHINHNRLDNRKSNLRVCDRFGNGRNLSLKSNNTSGYPGVSFWKSRNKWRARIKVNYVGIHIGLYDTLQEAVEARHNAEIKYFGDFRNKELNNDHRINS